MITFGSKSLSFFILLLFGIITFVAAADTNRDCAQAPDAVRIIFPGTSESGQQYKLSGENYWHQDKDSYQGPCPVISLHQHGNHIGRHKEKIIHLTDYLYSVPEIREAYETWLRLKKEAPGELTVMHQQTNYHIGDTRMFKVYNLEKSADGPAVFDDVLFELRATGEKSEIWVEQEEIAPGKIDDIVVEAMMEALEVRTPPRSVNPDQGIILNNIDFFANGNPALVPNPDGTGIVKVLIANIQDGWDPDEGGGFTAGFFNPGDLAPKTANRNSNQAAILYINSYPGIYTDTQPANPNRPLNTVAHEFQHLIQAGRGNLITFMDEGQSEAAEIFNGFNARSMVFLNDPNEVSGNVESQSQDGFLRWRRGEQDVLKDYQRAQLFHSYLYERAGLDAVGSLTQSSPGNPWVQYQRILDQSTGGLQFREVLADFYVANWLNDPWLDHGVFGYTLIQHAGVRATVPGRLYDAKVRPWVVNQPVSLQYGGAKYTQWRDVEDLSLNLNTTPDIHHYLIVERNEDTHTQVIKLDKPDIFLEGLHQSIVLVSVNTVVQSVNNFGNRQFSYSASWIPSDLRVVDISYSVMPVAGYVPIPLQSSSGVEFRGIAVRVSPEYDGVLQGVDVLLSHTDEAISGTGTLRVHVTESVLQSGTGSGQVWVPSDAIASVDVDIADLRPAMNAIDFSHLDIALAAGSNYHIFFEVTRDSENVELRFIFDQGSNDKENQNYYPVRTLLARYGSDGITGWSRLLGSADSATDNDNKNLVMTTRVRSRVPVDHEHTEPAISDRFELLPAYPNPFNAGVNIRFNIPDSVEDVVPVKIAVYDVLGRRVAVLFDEVVQAGVHPPVPFEPRNMASGVYIVRLQAGSSAADSKKIMYLK